MMLKNKDFHLLADEKPTAAFLKMESSKGYSEITRLRKPNQFFNENLPESAGNPKYWILTEQALIRSEMRRAFQQIYFKQDGLKTSNEEIIGFMLSGE